VSRCCHFFADAEVPGQPFEVTFGYLNPVIDRAAVRRTFGAVEKKPLVTVGCGG